MLTYQAALVDRPVAVLSIRVRSVKPPAHAAPEALSFSPPGFVPWRVRIRYATGCGAVRTYTGRLYAPPSSSYEVGCWQLLGHSLYVTFVPARRARPPLSEPPDPAKLAPQETVLHLPIRVPAWGLADVKGARHRLCVRASTADGRLSLVGRMRMDLGSLPIRVPFCCRLPQGVDGHLPCVAHGGLSGLSLKLQDGWIEGGAALWLWAAPAGGAHWHPYGPPAYLRQATGQVLWAGAAPAGGAAALVQGEVEADLFWVDRHAVSRCATTRSRWSAAADLPGYDTGCDRLEVGAQVSACRAEIAGTSTRIHLQVQVSVVALRPFFTPIQGGWVRSEQVTACWSGQVELLLPVLSHPARGVNGPEPIPQVEEAWQQLELGHAGALGVAPGAILIPVPGPVAAIIRCGPQGVLLVCEGTGPYFCAVSLPEAFAAWPIEQGGDWYLQAVPFLDV